jgi:hypothetical protein
MGPFKESSGMKKMRFEVRCDRNCCFRKIFQCNLEVAHLDVGVVVIVRT